MWGGERTGGIDADTAGDRERREGSRSRARRQERMGGEGRGDGRHKERLRQEKRGPRATPWLTLGVPPSASERDFSLRGRSLSGACWDVDQYASPASWLTSSPLSLPDLLRAAPLFPKVCFSPESRRPHHGPPLIRARGRGGPVVWRGPTASEKRSRMSPAPVWSVVV